MARFPEAEARLIRNKFVCKGCKSVIRSSNIHVLSGKVKCRRCNRKALRPMRKK